MKSTDTRWQQFVDRIMQDYGDNIANRATPDLEVLYAIMRSAADVFGPLFKGQGEFFRLDWKAQGAAADGGMDSRGFCFDA